MSSWVNVHVADHSFGVFDRYEIPIETADWATGLVVEMSSGAMIYTGHEISSKSVDEPWHENAAYLPP
jgi:hypothetical protein